MNELAGNIILSRRLATHKVWCREPRCAGAAWIDLLMLANREPADLFLRGEPIHLDRGQLGWSIESLAERWGRSREWATKFLRDLADWGQVKVDSNRRRTIITILNYDVYNPPMTGGYFDPFQTSDPTSEPASGSTSVPASEPAQSREKGEGEGRSEREGGTRGEGPPPERAWLPERLSGPVFELPSDDEVHAFCQAWKGDMARGIEGPIPQVWWLGWLASKVQLGPAAFPREWRRALVLAFTADWLAGHPKARPAASAGAPGEAGAGKEGVTARRIRLERQLADMDRAIAEHVANRHSAAFSPEHTEADREDLAAKKTARKKCAEDLAACGEVGR